MTGFRKVFLDTAPLIYYLENNPQYFSGMESFFDLCCEKEIEIVTSSITVEEYCVYPYRTGDRELIRKFYSFLNDMEIEIISVTRQIAEKAARIRAEYKDFKAMDALQLATASMTDCDMFLTNDRQLSQFRDIPCRLVDELE